MSKNEFEAAAGGVDCRVRVFWQIVAEKKVNSVENARGAFESWCSINYFASSESWNIVDGFGEAGGGRTKVGQIVGEKRYFVVGNEQQVGGSDVNLFVFV